MEDKRQSNIFACIECGSTNLIKDFLDLIHYKFKCMDCNWQDRRTHIDKAGAAREYNGNI